jgi:hypothetical protein
LERWPAPGADHTVGRPGTIVEPGGAIGTYIEQNVGSGWEFGKNHDRFVDKATACGMPDPVVNIPTMLPVYLYSIAKDIYTMPAADRPKYFPVLEIRW